MRDGKRLVVCVDDSLMVREMLQDHFEETDYLLELAENASDLEIKIQARPELLNEIDLFVFDFDMPEMTGTQIASVMDQLYDEFRDTPFIIFSGRPRDQVLEGIEQARAYSPTFAQNFRGYVEKVGGSLDTLLDRIKEVLDKSGQ